MRFLATSFIVLFAALFANVAFADSFTHYPDSVTFTPSQGQTTVTMNVYAIYNGDTSRGPGTTVHAWISTGSSYFRVDTVPHHFKTYWYWTVTYTVQTSQVTGYVSLSDDTNTQRIKLIGKAGAEGVLTGVGPYFTTSTKMDSTSCTTLRLINNGSHRDTIIAASWTHDPNGIFTWDTTNVPSTLGSHDTANWTFCFHAPHDTLSHVDTFNLAYRDSSGQTKYVTRIVTAKAAGPTPDAETIIAGPYFSSVQMDSTVCASIRLINNGADVDTITSYAWSHDPSGVFVLDSAHISLPAVLRSHDTLQWNICFHAPHDTLYHLDTLRVQYKDASSASRTVSRVVYGRAAAPAPDAAISAYGPYFPTTNGGSTRCADLRLINTGSDVDTITSIAWAHNPNGIFTYDTTIALPYVLRAHDTLLWPFCFHGPSDTNVHMDTVVIGYRDAYSTSRTISRIVYGKAVDSSLIDCFVVYAPSVPRTEVGDTSYVHIYIANRLDSSVTLTAMELSGSGDAAYRIDSSTFPHTIAGHHYDSVWVAFIPYSGATSFSATITGMFTVNDSVHCRTASSSLNGSAAYDADDTTSVSSGDSATPRIAMSDERDRHSHRVEFFNTSNERLLVHSLTLTNSSHFYIAQILPGAPDTVAPGGHISAIIHFYGDSVGTTYNDTLVVDIENGHAPYYVYISGESANILHSGVTAVQRRSQELRINPNPSRGMTTIALSGAERVHFEILDLLGNTVARHDGSANWLWNVSELPPGVYYVRAVSQNAVETRRIAILK